MPPICLETLLFNLTFNLYSAKLFSYVKFKCLTHLNFMIKTVSSSLYLFQYSNILNNVNFTN